MKHLYGKVNISEKFGKDDIILHLGRGRPLPLGADKIIDGLNFSIYSGKVDKMSLLIFKSDHEEPFVELELDEIRNRTGDIWHIYIEGLPENIKYGYRVHGEYNPSKGLYYKPDQILFDPYSLALSGSAVWGSDFKRKNGVQEYGYQRRSFVPETDFDWGDDCQLNTPYRDTVIYELHVRGFTKHKSSRVKEKGTFKGLISKIPYLKKLGITAVELMPIQEFDENENININPETGEYLKNFWGYSTLAFFAPKASYASTGVSGGQIIEFKEMVKAFHKAGIEVILDIVYNHTGEGQSQELVYSYKGLDARSYYMINEENGEFMNFSGCGNTFNCNHPIGRNLIMDSLRYWVTQMHVDGFRFDLASIMGRDEQGNVLPNPPIIDHIARDPVLAKTKIIAEAWDAAGLYQVGSFPGTRWAEWNGKYRDCIRKLVKGENGVLGEFVHRLKGSPDLYQTSNREPYHSINFICSHDGFTLQDMVTYFQKHNLKNGENNNDGDNSNHSSNYGLEGPSEEAGIVKFRKKQVKNFLALLLLSQGTPMFTAGDEFYRTQNGNNNAYCQDNSISWLNWEDLKTHSDLFEFTRNMIKLRKETPLIGIESFAELENDINVRLHGIEPDNPDFSYYSRSMAIEFEDISLNLENKYKKIYIVFNFWQEYLEYKLPSGNWSIKVDTAGKPTFYDKPLDINRKYLMVCPFSLMVLVENFE
ncbi:glycogen debranching protein GlgX [bacterium]|nr:glycogen debranching protein GlgX [bacterium]